MVLINVSIVFYTMKINICILIKKKVSKEYFMLKIYKNDIIGYHNS